MNTPLPVSYTLLTLQNSQNPLTAKKAKLPRGSAGTPGPGHTRGPDTIIEGHHLSALLPTLGVLIDSNVGHNSAQAISLEGTKTQGWHDRIKPGSPNFFQLGNLITFCI